MRNRAIVRMAIPTLCVAVCVAMAGCASPPRANPAASGTVPDPDMRAYIADPALPGSEKKRRAEAESYLAEHPGLPPETRQAIREGKVILGMCPEDARAAGGRCEMAYVADPKWGENPDPLELALAQRDRPDSSRISLTFKNRTQFDTGKSVAFTAVFEKGRAVRIERD